MKQVSSHHLLGLRVDALTLSDLQAIAARTIENGQRCLIANHNLHSVYLYHNDAKMREFYSRAQYVQIDGMPLILLGKLSGYPLQAEHRLGAVDWIPHLMEDAARRGWRIFHLGSKPGVAERGAKILRNDFPGLHISTAHGYFDAGPNSSENRKILKLVNNYRPNVLIVGMGMPRQEHWITDNLENIQANVVINAGAYMDFVAGAASTPPRWTGPLYLEWLYRLIKEPRRLWKRYLLEPWFVLGLGLTEWVKLGGVRRIE
jgi:N-acetylglucosaminyldiphosphoundecaprenol N-acetyl-beta-D-mannosaminyltransferase